MGKARSASGAREVAGHLQQLTDANLLSSLAVLDHLARVSYGMMPVSQVPMAVQNTILSITVRYRTCNAATRCVGAAPVL